MKRVYVTITPEEHGRLERIAAEHKAKGELLAGFVADLTCSDRSGGSDERMYATDWFDRQTWRWSDGKLTT